MGRNLVTTNRTGTTMSVLMSFIYKEFPARNEYDEPIENCVHSIHIAQSGWLGDALLHIKLEETYNGDNQTGNAVEINLTLEQARLVLENIKKFVNYQTTRLDNHVLP